MHIKIILTGALIAIASLGFSQDTTGGTRPALIIPLHRKAPTDKTNLSGKQAYIIESPADKKTNPGGVKRPSHTKRKHPAIQH